MSKLLLLLLSAVSAVLTTVAFPWFDLGFLAWFGLAPLLFGLRHARPLTGGALGLVFGVIFAAGVFYWLDAVVGSVARVLLMYIAFATYYLGFGLLYSSTSRLMGSWMIVGAPALWVALEYTRSNLSFLAFPWNLLGHSQYRYLPLIQIADVTGVYGISFLVVMVNQAISEVPDLLANGRRMATRITTLRGRASWGAPLLAVGLSLLITLAYGWYRLALPESADGHLRVAIVQANLRPRNNMPRAEQARHLAEYARLTREAAESRPDLIVWPSSSLPGPISFRPVQFFVTRLARETGTYLLVGGAGGDKFAPPKDGYLPFSNSEFLFSRAGRLEGQYSKIWLTPFDEFLPFRDVIRWPRWITGLEHSFVPGTEYTLFQVSGARFGAPICWENTFPDLFRRFVRDGANFMVSVTNEGFFGATAGPYQTLAMNVFRAVENRVAIVRAATTGVSGFISPKGEVVARIADGNGKDLFVSGVLVRDVPLSKGKTLYTVYGDVFAHAAIGVAALLTLASLFSQAARPAASKAARSEDPERAPAGVQ